VSRRDEFLSVASHELRTPLTPLRLRLQGLKRELDAEGLPPTTRERVTRSLEGAELQVQRVAELVEGMLAVAQLGAHPVELSREALDLSRLVAEEVAHHAPRSAKAGCRVEVEAASGVTGPWDREKLRQVLGSLLSNALKFGAGGTVSVRLEATPDTATLTVRDQGPGIAPEDLPRIFSKFGRAVSARHYGGLGLGLYLADQWVKALGGSIEVESQPGRGATFRLVLPRTPPVRASTSTR